MANFVADFQGVTEQVRALEEQGKSVVLIGKRTSIAGLIVLQGRLREGLAKIIANGLGAGRLVSA